MIERFCGLSVTFEKDIRDDDAQHIMNAIRMIKGVINVSPVSADIDGSYMKAHRIKMKFIKNLDKFLVDYEWSDE